MIYIKNLCIFYLFAKIILHLCPKESYENYINALIEWTALIILILPLLSRSHVSSSYEEWEQKLYSYIGDSKILEEEIPDILSEDAVNKLCQDVTKKTVNEMNSSVKEKPEQGEGEKNESG